MDFALLDGHDAIAWDFDGTLFEHPLAVLMHEYIRDHPEKRHVIVTFRSGNMQGRPWIDYIWDELAEYEVALTKDHFDGILNMDEETFDENCARAGGRIMSTDTYKAWKGMICAANGLTVLVDDNEADTLPGCQAHGIAYVNPDELTGLTALL